MSDKDAAKELAVLLAAIDQMRASTSELIKGFTKEQLIDFVEFVTPSDEDPAPWIVMFQLAMFGLSVIMEQEAADYVR